MTILRLTIALLAFAPLGSCVRKGAEEPVIKLPETYAAPTCPPGDRSPLSQAPALPEEIAPKVSKPATAAKIGKALFDELAASLGESHLNSINVYDEGAHWLVGLKAGNGYGGGFVYQIAKCDGRVLNLTIVE